MCRLQIDEIVESEVLTSGYGFQVPNSRNGEYHLSRLPSIPDKIVM